MERPDDFSKLLEQFAPLQGDNVHFAFLGAGPIESHLELITSQFLQAGRSRAQSARTAAVYFTKSEKWVVWWCGLGFNHISIVYGGYEALHSLLAKSASAFPHLELADHIPRQCLLCLQSQSVHSHPSTTGPQQIATQLQSSGDEITKSPSSYLSSLASSLSRAKPKRQQAKTETGSSTKEGAGASTKDADEIFFTIDDEEMELTQERKENGNELTQVPHEIIDDASRTEEEEEATKTTTKPEVLEKKEGQEGQEAPKQDDRHAAKKESKTSEGSFFAPQMVKSLFSWGRRAEPVPPTAASKESPQNSSSSSEGEQGLQTSTATEPPPSSAPPTAQTTSEDVQPEGEPFKASKNSSLSSSLLAQRASSLVSTASQLKNSLLSWGMGV